MIIDILTTEGEYKIVKDQNIVDYLNNIKNEFLNEEDGLGEIDWSCDEVDEMDGWMEYGFDGSEVCGISIVVKDDMSNEDIQKLVDDKMGYEVGLIEE